MLSSHAVDGHQMYFGGWVVGHRQLVYRSRPPTPPLISTGGQKVRNFASFSKLLNFQPPAFKSAARYPNAEAIADAIVSHHTYLVLLHCLRKCSSSEIA